MRILLRVGEKRLNQKKKTRRKILRTNAKQNVERKKKITKKNTRRQYNE